MILKSIPKNLLFYTVSITLILCFYSGITTVNAQKKYVEKHGFSISDIDNAKKMADAWIKLEAQVLRKFQEAEEISAVI